MPLPNKPNLHQIELTISTHLLERINKFKGDIAIPSTPQEKVIVHLIEMGLRAHKLKDK